MSKSPIQPIVLSSPGQRGNAAHQRRSQIIAAADEHFRLYGYRKTSVAELGKAIGVSGTYLYRFFKSKQAIGEAVVTTVLERLDEELQQVVGGSDEPTQKLRSFMQLALERSLEIFFDGTRLHELVLVAMDESWAAAIAHEAVLQDMVRELIREGREAGAFERKTPLDEVVAGIVEALRSFSNPVALQYRARERLEAALAAIVTLILRSLAP